MENKYSENVTDNDGDELILSLLLLYVTYINEFYLVFTLA